jgi:hypothetical protein
LSQFFHRSLQVSFIFVPTTGDLTLVNVDTKMSEDSNDAMVVHGTHLVYVAVLSKALCREVHLLAHHALGVRPVLSEHVIEGIKSTGKNNKELSWPPHSANFGVTLCPQASTRGSLNSQTQSIDESIRSVREGYVKTSASFFQHTFVPVVQPMTMNSFQRSIVPPPRKMTSTETAQPKKLEGFHNLNQTFSNETKCTYLVL